MPKGYLNIRRQFPDNLVQGLRGIILLVGLTEIAY